MATVDKYRDIDGYLSIPSENSNVIFNAELSLSRLYMNFFEINEKDHIEIAASMKILLNMVQNNKSSRNQGFVYENHVVKEAINDERTHLAISFMQVQIHELTHLYQVLSCIWVTKCQRVERVRFGFLYYCLYVRKPYFEARRLHIGGDSILNSFKIPEIKAIISKIRGLTELYEIMSTERAGVECHYNNSELQINLNDVIEGMAVKAQEIYSRCSNNNKFLLNSRYYKAEEKYLNIIGILDCDIDARYSGFIFFSICALTLNVSASPESAVEKFYTASRMAGKLLNRSRDITRSVSKQDIADFLKQALKTDFLYNYGISMKWKPTQQNREQLEVEGIFGIKPDFEEIDGSTHNLWGDYWQSVAEDIEEIAKSDYSGIFYELCLDIDVIYKNVYANVHEANINEMSAAAYEIRMEYIQKKPWGLSIYYILWCLLKQDMNDLYRAYQNYWKDVHETIKNVDINNPTAVIPRNSLSIVADIEEFARRGTAFCCETHGITQYADIIACEEKKNFKWRVERLMRKSFNDIFYCA